MMLPQLGMLGGVPAPMKDRIASVIIAAAAMKVPCTSSGGNVLGRMWRHRIAEKPVPLAMRRLDIGLLAQGQHDAAHQPGDARHLGDGDREDHVLDAGAGQRHQRDRDQHRRDRHQPVHDPHDDRVDPAGEAGDEADREAERGR